ncbi:helix-turn-helix domain-containing protein [Caulobacter sp. KR2-114]|uniref:helix-turn-helix domain-containing protein n=1 Tax=Caulobacter sp. KR2-114 TaxID=3400912 RepID=UPI003BFC8DFC
MTRKVEASQRRRPRQARSRATYDSILQAALEVLARDGAGRLTTNRVAERAGVSIGTLYQYFPDKTAILLAAARREALAGTSLAGCKALLDALARRLEELLGGGLAGAAGAVASRAARRASPWDGLERRAADWLAWLLPQPALMPVRARRRF